MCGTRRPAAPAIPDRPCYDTGRMADKDLMQILRDAGKAEGEAADELARAVEAILRRLKRGEPVSLPGVGRLVPGRGRQVRLEPAGKQGGRRGRG